MYVGIDIGGTNTVIASADDSGNIIKKIINNTPEDPDEAIKLFKSTVKIISDGKKIKIIGAGCGSPLDWKNGIIQSPPHKRKWKNLHIKEIFEKEFGCPFLIDNDANVAALGEYEFGEGKKFKSMIYITLSTGVGAALLINGAIYRGKNGEHPEMGHQSIPWKLEKHTTENTTCICGNDNCLENFVSGAGIKRIYGKSPEKINDQKIWNEIGYNLGQGLRNIIYMHVPECIVFGGGVAIGAGDMVLGPAKKIVEEEVKMLSKPIIRITKLGRDLGIKGAIAFAMKGNEV